MGFLQDARNKAANLVAANRGKIDSGMAKAGHLASRRTHGKHDDKIDGGLRKVSAGLDKIAEPGPEDSG